MWFIHGNCFIHDHCFLKPSHSIIIIYKPVVKNKFTMGKCCKSVHNKILHKNMTWLYIILCSLHGRWGWFQTQEITLSHYNHYILAFSYKQIYCTSCCKSVHNKILHESVTWLYFILRSLHIRKGWFQTLVDYVKNMVTCLSLGVTFNHMALSSTWELLGKQCW